MSTPVHRFRMAMARHLGKPLTPEVAAAIEAEAFHEPDQTIDGAALGQAGYGGLEFQAERFEEVLPELHALHEQHWAETERARHGFAMNPDYDYMCAAQRRGLLLQLTARHHGELVGNIRLYRYRDLHTQTDAAREDTFYLAPHARRGLAAIAFWRFAERCLTRLGVREVRTDSKILKDENGHVVRNVGRLNERLGYTHVANQYLKTLPKE